MKRETETILDLYNELYIIIETFNNNYKEDVESGVSDRINELNTIRYNAGAYSIMLKKEDISIKKIKDDIEAGKIEAEIGEIETEVGEIETEVCEIEALEIEALEIEVEDEAEVSEIEFEDEAEVDEIESEIEFESLEIVMNHIPDVQNNENEWIHNKHKSKKNNGKTRVFNDTVIDLIDNMNFDEILEKDLNDQLIIKGVKGIDNHKIDYPSNILEKQSEGIHFIFTHDPLESYESPKSPFILRKGKYYYTLNWIGSDQYLYIIDKNNKLVISKFRDNKQIWHRGTGWPDGQKN